MGKVYAEAVPVDHGADPPGLSLVGSTSFTESTAATNGRSPSSVGRRRSLQRRLRSHCGFHGDECCDSDHVGRAGFCRRGGQCDAVGSGDSAPTMCSAIPFPNPVHLHPLSVGTSSIETVEVPMKADTLRQRQSLRGYAVIYLNGPVPFAANENNAEFHSSTHQFTNLHE